MEAVYLFSSMIVFGLIMIAILSYREQQGPFRTVEDLMKVEGIKEKTWEKIKEDITV